MEHKESRADPVMLSWGAYAPGLDTIDRGDGWTFYEDCMNPYNVFGFPEACVCVWFKRDQPNESYVLTKGWVHDVV
jgi:hypothetical protein